LAWALRVQHFADAEEPKSDRVAERAGLPGVAVLPEQTVPDARGCRVQSEHSEAQPILGAGEPLLYPVSVAPRAALLQLWERPAKPVDSLRLNLSKKLEVVSEAAGPSAARQRRPVVASAEHGAVAKAVAPSDSRPVLPPESPVLPPESREPPRQCLLWRQPRQPVWARPEFACGVAALPALLLPGARLRPASLPGCPHGQLLQPIGLPVHGRWTAARSAFASRLPRYPSRWNSNGFSFLKLPTREACPGLFSALLPAPWPAR